MRAWTRRTLQRVVVVLVARLLLLDRLRWLLGRRLELLIDAWDSNFEH